MAKEGSVVREFVVTEAERKVAELLPIDADPEVARATVAAVPFWFHTFALGREHAIYTPGAARDHRYRLPWLPDDLTGKTMLDVGTFDGFYAFLCEHRGAARVLAIDNEQYRQWVAARWGIKLEGGTGFRVIQRLLGSRAEYRRMDAFALDRLEEQFDLVCCFGILHRVENPLGLLQQLRTVTAPGGTVLIETYGLDDDRGAPSIRVSEPGEVYERDEFVYWGFGKAALERLARIAGFVGAAQLEIVNVDGHPRIVGRLRT